MICNKCGANIEEKAKFCGYCGNVVEGDLQKVEEESVVEETATVSNDDLGKTVKVDTTEINNELSSEESDVQETLNQSNVQMSNTNKAKKNNKLLLIIIGIVLVVIAIAIAAFAFIKLSNNPVNVLGKALNNMYNKGESSSTIEATLNLGTATGDGLAISLTVKNEAENAEKYKTQITLNKSLFFEEISLYSLVDKNEMMVYLESSLIDMLGMTSSLEPIWLYYKLPLDEVTSALPEEQQEIDLNEIIDREHFKYIDSNNGLKHYILTIDQKLVDTVKSKLSESESKELEEMLNSMKDLQESIKIDFYITSDDELSRIEFNMNEILKDIDNDGITEFVISMEFKDMGNTKVNIPNEALNSTTDIETYISTNQIGEVYEDSFDNDSNYDNEFDTNFDLNEDSFDF